MKAADYTTDSSITTADKVLGSNSVDGGTQNYPFSDIIDFLGSYFVEYGPQVRSTDSNYTLSLSDAFGLVEMNNASANTITVPLNSSQAFPNGTRIRLSQYGAGETSVVATGGVTILSEGSALKINARYAVAYLEKTDTNTWLLYGSIKP